MTHHLRPTFEHNGHVYEIGRVDPFDGSWLLMLMVNKMQAEMRRRLEEGAVIATPAETSNDVEKQEIAPGPEYYRQTANFMLSKLDRKELRDVQELCLRHVWRRREMAGTEVAWPIYDGDWKVEDLREQPQTALELTRRVLALNISPTSPAAE